MIEIIERVARAIANERWGGLSDGEWREVRLSVIDEARAAIEAMREPTAHMLEKADQDAYGDEIGDYQEHAAKVFTTMIDAALNEGTQ